MFRALGTESSHRAEIPKREWTIEALARSHTEIEYCVRAFCTSFPCIMAAHLSFDVRCAVRLDNEQKLNNMCQRESPTARDNYAPNFIHVVVRALCHAHGMCMQRLPVFHTHTLTHHTRLTYTLCVRNFPSAAAAAQNRMLFSYSRGEKAKEMCGAAAGALPLRAVLHAHVRMRRRV